MFVYVIKAFLGDVISMFFGWVWDIVLIVDDGMSSVVVGVYLNFVWISGVWLTFFLNGSNLLWIEHVV